jgi:hypothetical protein
MILDWCLSALSLKGSLSRTVNIYLNIQNRIKKEARLQVRALGKADSIQKTWFRNFVGQTLFYNYFVSYFLFNGIGKL